MGVGTVHCLDVLPERAGVCVAFGAAGELTHVWFLLDGQWRQQAKESKQESAEETGRRGGISWGGGCRGRMHNTHGIKERVGPLE